MYRGSVPNVFSHSRSGLEMNPGPLSDRRCSGGRCSNAARRLQSMIPLLMKVFINVGDEERKKIALFQILVLVAKIPPYCKQQLLRQKYYFFWIVPSLYFRCAALEVSESFHHVVRTPHCDLFYEALEKLSISDPERCLPFFD